MMTRTSGTPTYDVSTAYDPADNPAEFLLTAAWFPDLRHRGFMLYHANGVRLGTCLGREGVALRFYSHEMNEARDAPRDACISLADEETRATMLRWYGRKIGFPATCGPPAFSLVPSGAPSTPDLDHARVFVDVEMAIGHMVRRRKLTPPILTPEGSMGARMPDGSLAMAARVLHVLLLDAVAHGVSKAIVDSGAAQPTGAPSPSAAWVTQTAALRLAPLPPGTE